MAQTETDLRIIAHLRRLIQTRFGSAYALAKKVGVHPSTLYKMFSGSRGVGADVLKQLHDGLGISADVFLDDDPDKKYWQAGPYEGRRGRRPAGAEAISQSPAARQGSGR